MDSIKKSFLEALQVLADFVADEDWRQRYYPGY